MQAFHPAGRTNSFTSYSSRCRTAARVEEDQVVGITFWITFICLRTPGSTERSPGRTHHNPAVKIKGGSTRIWNRITSLIYYLVIDQFVLGNRKLDARTEVYRYLWANVPYIYVHIGNKHVLVPV